MATNRRDFIKGTAWMGAAAALTGCATSAKLFGTGKMSAFADKPFETLRVGHIGLGMRGPSAVHRMAMIPGVKITALCDLYEPRVAAQQKWLNDNKRPDAKGYFGEEAYKELCESDEVDLVYITTPWALHAPIAIYAMEHGKHVAIEVPAAMTIEECWALVETSERTGRHCMQLENCCYNDAEMMCLNLVRQGVLGEIQHAEGAYIHDLRSLNYLDPAKGGYQSYWRLKWNIDHKGNPYPTHGLVPVMQAMNINRGDRFDYLNCVQCDPVCNDIYAAAKFGKGSWQAQLHPECGDMSTTIVHTVKGRTIMIQHDVNSPRPYSRLNLVQGTKGIFNGISFVDNAAEFMQYGNGVHFCWEEKVGDGAHSYFSFEKTQEMRQKYMHPLWKDVGEPAKKVGGHGGMDFLMDLRLAYCLQNGLPLDMDVYDLASSCALCELSDRSARDRGNAQEIPDFTRGGWETAKPLGIESVDETMRAKVMDLLTGKVKDNSQLNV